MILWCLDFEYEAVYSLFWLILDIWVLLFLLIIVFLFVYLVS